MQIKLIWRNHQPSLSHLCIRVIQNRNQPCHRASFSFHAEKVKEALGAMLSGTNYWNKNIYFIKKIRKVKVHLKYVGFSLLWKLVNMATFRPIIFLYEGSRQSTETVKFFLTFFCRRELLESSAVSQAEIRKDLISHFTSI